MPDKSNICIEKEKAEEPYDIYLQIVNNQSLAAKVCPKSCDYQVIILNRYTQTLGFLGFSGTKSKRITLTYPKFIKVSTSSISYTLLELVAEVGGYVGLFLGISVNQSLNLLSTMITSFNQLLIKLMK